MNKNVKGLLSVLCVAAVAMGVWHFTNQNKKAYARAIIKLGGSDSFAGLIILDEGYLKAWARALHKNQREFTYNNQTYNSQGGRKKQ
jgi:hypothetical protein